MSVVILWLPIGTLVIHASFSPSYKINVLLFNPISKNAVNFSSLKNLIYESDLTKLEQKIFFISILLFLNSSLIFEKFSFGKHKILK